MSPPRTLQLSAFPEELLSNVLEHIPTKELLSFSAASHRLRESANTLLAQRLRRAEPLGDGYSFIFECSTPARRTITPYRHCHYKGLATPITTDQSLADVYSHFAPYVHYPHASHDAAPRPVSTAVFLDEFEFFTQLCTNAVLVRLGPQRGQFASPVRVFDNTFFRLRRTELEASARLGAALRTVWLDEHRNAGLRLRVRKQERLESDEDEDGPMSYMVEYEEVVVRTAYLVYILEAERERRTKEEAAAAATTATTTVGRV